MTIRSLAELREIAHLLHQREVARQAPILREEARLKAELSRLDDLAHAVRADLHDIGPVRLTGADTLWFAWLERQRADLRRSLALVLARKAEETDALRQAFGRVRATDQIGQSAAAEARRLHLRRAEQAMADLVSLKARRR